MKFQSKVQESTYYQEWAYVQGRQFLLFLLALGSLLVTFRIGHYIGDTLFPHSPTLLFFIKVFFVLLGYLGIDWVLANALASASIVTTDKNGLDLSEKKRSVWLFVFAALSSTIGLSIASNLFVSEEMAGASHLTHYNEQVKGAMSKDSLLKMRAFDVLLTTGAEEQKRIHQAKKEKNRLIAEAVATGSESWKSDYYKHRNNPRAWFWTCTNCPRAYRRYREQIKMAIEEGDQQIREAHNYAKSIQATLAPTLSYQMMTDSVLNAVGANVTILESERKSRESKLNLILFVLTMSTGILALILTFVLREHRKEHGQQVPENHVRPVMVMQDMITRLVSSLSDLVYTLIAEPFNRLKRNGYIKTYKIKENRSTDTYAFSNSPIQSEERLCLTCRTDITHKRKDAKFCSDKCRMDYHHYIPSRSKNGMAV